MNKSLIILMLTLITVSGMIGAVSAQNETQTQTQTQDQTQTLTNTNTNTLTNTNTNTATSTSAATNTNTITNTATFNPILINANINRIGPIRVASLNIDIPSLLGGLI